MIYALKRRDGEIVATYAGLPTRVEVPGTSRVLVMGDDLSDWSDDEYAIVIYDVPEAAPSKAELKASAASKRYLVEIGGCCWNDQIVQTDRESQSKLLSEFIATIGGHRSDPSIWKFRDGFASISNAEMITVAMTVREHVSMSFSVEADLFTKIDAGTVNTVSQVENADWPPNI